MTLMSIFHFFRAKPYLMLLTCLRGPSKIWSVRSLPALFLRLGRSPMYFRTALKAYTASCASSSFCSSFLSSGCLIGSREYRQRASPIGRRAEVIVRDIVRFGGGLTTERLETLTMVLYKCINITELISALIQGKYRC